MPDIVLDHHTHRMDPSWIPIVDEAEKKILACFGADSSKLVMTSSGAEAISHVLFSTYLDIVRETGRNQFLSTTIEDHSILMGLKSLKKFDCHARLLQVDEAGRLRKEVLEEAITPQTVMLCLALASPLIGVVQPMEDLVSVCKKKEILLHVDLSCAPAKILGKIFSSLQGFDIDFLTFEGSLLGAPIGTGGIIVRKGLTLSPLIHGRPPFNAPLFVALGDAMKKMDDEFDGLCTETARLRQKFEEEVHREIPDAVFFFQDTERLPNTSVVAFPKIAGELLAFHLQRKGVFASFGGEANQPLASVLTACGIRADLAQCAVSFALAYETREEEIVQAVSILVETVGALKRYYD